jgi:outer membrane protein
MTMTKSPLLALAAIIFTCLSNVALAQSKVAFVNTEKILKESALAQDAQKVLSNEFSKREASLLELASSLKSKSEKLERDGSTMSATERQKLQTELADSDAKFQRDRRNLEEEVQSRRSQLLANILERANREIIKIAEADKIDIVFQDAVWVSPKIDITTKVLDALKK